MVFSWGLIGLPYHHLGQFPRTCLCRWCIVVDDVLFHPHSPLLIDVLASPPNEVEPLLFASLQNFIIKSVRKTQPDWLELMGVVWDWSHEMTRQDRSNIILDFFLLRCGTSSRDGRFFPTIFSWWWSQIFYRIWWEAGMRVLIEPLTVEMNFRGPFWFWLRPDWTSLSPPWPVS